MSKSHCSLCVSFSRTDARLCIYHLQVWLNFDFFQNSQGITLSTQSCLVYSPSFFWYPKLLKQCKSLEVWIILLIACTADFFLVNSMYVGFFLLNNPFESQIHGNFLCHFFYVLVFSGTIYFQIQILDICTLFPWFSLLLSHVYFYKFSFLVGWLVGWLDFRTYQSL